RRRQRECRADPAASSTAASSTRARCITDVRADAGSTTFLAGTLSLKEENEVHLIRLLPGENELVCDGLFYHPNEIWDLKSCPFDHRLFSTVYTSGEGYGASVWKIPELYGQSNSPQLEQLFMLDDHTDKIRCVLWWPLGKHDKLISIDDRNIFLWNIDPSNKSAKVISQGSADMLPNLRGGAWDPHNHNAVATITDSSLHFWDLRSMKRSNAIEHAHIRDVDYNPKKQNIIATAEDEFGIRLWDLRMLKHPLKDLPGHSHWTWAVRHNPEVLERIQLSIYGWLKLALMTLDPKALLVRPLGKKNHYCTRILTTKIASMELHGAPMIHRCLLLCLMMEGLF
uniref:EIPR1-like beta-propeller domain-containing protein n=1 Tax=Aegilops tauschii subsp. strangulata TaxID=200361 RepID=A0A453RQW7_AEGTS